MLGKINNNSSNIKGAKDAKILSGLDKNTIQDGLVFFARILDAKGEEMDWDSVIVCPTKSGRSYCHRNYLFICPKDKSSISAHEPAHAFTYQNKKAFDHEKNLFHRFTKTQNGTKIYHRLNEMPDNAKCRDDELYCEPITEELFPTLYCAKFYANGDTELLSMLSQKLHEDPHKVIEKYREWYEETLKW